MNKIDVFDTYKEKDKKVAKSSNLIDFSNKKKEIAENEPNDKEFEELIYFTEKMYTQTLSNSQVDTLHKIYYDLKLPFDVIEYLIEYVSQNNESSPRYIMTIANSWYEKSIRTRADAEAYSGGFSKKKNEIKINEIIDKEIRKKGERYFEKYKSKSFTFDDAIELFFNSSEETKATIEYIKQLFLLDIVQVAFDEPESKEKIDYIKNRYGKGHYKEFLESFYWQIIAKYKKMQCDYKCQHCGMKKQLNTHHNNYEIHGQEHLKENIDNIIKCLCQECHKSLHESKEIK